jgi:hypothetical protein
VEALTVDHVERQVGIAEVGIVDAVDDLADLNNPRQVSPHHDESQVSIAVVGVVDAVACDGSIIDVSKSQSIATEWKLCPAHLDMMQCRQKENRRAQWSQGCSGRCKSTLGDVIGP